MLFESNIFQLFILCFQILELVLNLGDIVSKFIFNIPNSEFSRIKKELPFQKKHI